MPIATAPAPTPAAANAWTDRCVDNIADIVADKIDDKPDYGLHPDADLPAYCGCLYDTLAEEYDAATIQAVKTGAMVAQWLDGEFNGLVRPRPESELEGQPVGLAMSIANLICEPRHLR